MSKKKIPFYLVVVKTKDDKIYSPIDGCLNPREADNYADEEIKEICKQGLPIAKKQAVELHLVIEEWESETDYDNGAGSVQTIRDTPIFAKKSVAEKYNC